MSNSGSGDTIQASDGLNYTPYRLISSIEADAVASYMMRQSGLKRDQIAINNWGFPAIPIPEVRKLSGRTRLAPREVRGPFLGHPIYWIEPELTERLEDETDERWSIRMFFLINRMGYWVESGWINFLDSKGFAYSIADIEGYHMLGHPEISTDRDSSYALLGEKDIQGGLEKADQDAADAIKMCWESLIREVEQFTDRQAKCVIHAENIIGGKSQLYDYTNNANVPGSTWEREIEPILADLSKRYDRELRSVAPSMAPILEDVLREFDSLQKLVIMMEYITATISVPAIHSETGSFSEGYSQMISVLGVATSQASKRQIGYDIVESSRECFTGDRYPGALNETISNAYDSYMMSWRRMRLALANYHRNGAGQPPYLSYQELEVNLVNKARQEEEEVTRTVRVELDQDEYTTAAESYDEGGRIITRREVDNIGNDLFADLDEVLKREGL